MNTFTDTALKTITAIGLLALALTASAAELQPAILSFSNAAPLASVEMAGLQGSGNKYTGQATLVLEDGTRLALSATQVVKKKGAKLVLKSQGEGPKVRGKVKIAGSEQVRRIRFLYKTDDIKVKVKDAGQVALFSSSTNMNSVVASLPAWPVESEEVPEPLDLGADLVNEGDTQFVCSSKQRDLKKNFSDIVTVSGANAGVLWPGALVQGRSVQDGLLASLPIRRSPITISTSLAIEDPSRRIESPDSASVQDAIADLQREADTRLGALDVIPAMIDFSKTEVHSFEQSMMDIGVSAKYGSAFASIKASVDYSTSSSVESHTVLVRMMQPMYTISFADEAHPTPADFMHEDVTQDDVQKQIDAGTVGPQNLPTYVKSVTYGRMMIFTMTSTEAESASELEAAIEGNYGLFSGEASISERQRELLSTSKVTMMAFGGSQEDALRAIRPPCPKASKYVNYTWAEDDVACTPQEQGGWAAFLKPGDATQAVPLSYRINNLKDRTTAVLGDATSFVERICTPVTAVRFTATLESIETLQAGEGPYTMWASTHNGYDKRFDFDCSTEGNVETIDFDWVLEKTTSHAPSVEIESYIERGCPADALVCSLVWLGSETRFRTVEFPLETNPYTFTQQFQQASCIAEATWTVRVEPLL